MNFENDEFAKGIGFTIVGIVLLIISIPSFVEASEGKHFGGVYGIIGGIFCVFEGIRNTKNSLKSGKK